MSKSVIDRIKLILSTAEHSDVNFLVGDGEAKELASDVFEAMFRFDAKKEQGENAAANCPDVVEIPDVEPSAFKLMLCCIYTGNLSGLNADNAMAVLYAAVNRRQMLGPSLFKIRFPLFSHEDFSEKIGEMVWSKRYSETVYINGLPWKILAQIKTKNGSTDNEKWLGIYLLFVLALQRSFGNFSNYFTKNGVDNSIGTFCDHVFDNKSTSWGFPNFISFAELMDSSNGIYKREEDKLTLAIDLIVKEEKMEKFVSDPNKSKGIISMEIEKVSEFAREIIWSEHKIWECKCLATLRIVSQKNSIADYWREFSEERTFSSKLNSGGWEYDNFISFAELMDTSKGFFDKSEDKVTLAIDFTVKEAKMEDKS
ncbi:hypothetical protein niasHT_003303 [Heterodera trifolii]|uniref:MATH domain-containing protein n=1 Tax=Heterodera trifolii TaxID=157864 RepID=A0ABD2LXT2_9BILA